MAESAVVLLSAGLDSSYNFKKAMERFSVKLALTFNYGQRAAVKEIASAARLASHYGVPHKVLELKWFGDFTRTALLGGLDVPQGETVKIDDFESSMQTARAVWVPNRNGIFLNIAAGYAEGLGAAYVIPGFNKEEAQTFPDNSQDYLESLTESWRYSTNSHVQAFCFSGNMDKSEIVSESVKAGLPLTWLWPCYLAQDKWCGECESCLRFKRAVEANGLSYAELRQG